MKLIKEDWWPTPIYYIDIPKDDIDYEILETEVQKHKSIDPGRQRSNRGGYQSNDVDTKNYSELTKLKNLVAKHFHNCFEEWKINNVYEIGVSNIWVNVNTQGNFNMPHTHPGSIFSAVYYVKCTNNHPPITFYNPSTQDFFIDSITKVGTIYTYPTVQYSAIVGRLIIFPSWLSHTVDHQDTNEERISISFNSTF